MKQRPNIIVEIGDRYCTARDGTAGYKLRAVIKFTHKTPPLPGIKNKDTQWFGPFGIKNDPVTEGGEAGQWGTAEAVKLLRAVADELEAKDAYLSKDGTVGGDLLTVMEYELSK